MEVFKVKFKTGFVYFLAILCASGSSFSANDGQKNASIKKQTLLNHIFLMQDLKKCFKESQPSTAHPIQNGILTPTQAYLSIPTLKQGVEKRWSNEIKRHKPMIDTVMAREKEFQDTHYVFYHAQNGYFRILQDFLKEWYRLLNIKEELNNFDMLRIWNKADQTADAIGFLDNYKGNINDQIPEMQQTILSVNLSLFGNTLINNYCSSFYYFESNYSMSPPNIGALMQNVFTEHGIDHKHIDALFKLAVEENKANLLQIFIPKELVDQCAYLALPLGKPDNNSVVNCCFDKMKGWHTKISPILDLYQKNPTAIIPERLDLLQARIILSQDIMLNPDSGVKIFRYSPIDDTKMKSYQNEVQAFAKTVFLEYLVKKIDFNKKTNLTTFLKQLGMNCNLPEILQSPEQIQISSQVTSILSSTLSKLCF